MTNQPALIAILRGIEPPDAESVADVLLSSGVTHFEVTLNSPSPLVTIERMARHVGANAVVGAGTVLDEQSVADVNQAGGQFIVSPNCHAGVIRTTKTFGMRSYPGVFTATEAFTAIEAGCDALKLFPASTLGPSGIAALSAVLPGGMPLYAVGGVSLDNLGTWASVGVKGVGIGSALYKAGKSPTELEKDATAFVNACQSTFAVKH